MADIYVRSTDGSDADNGSTWALAKATLAGAAAIDAAGDTIYVSQAHSESSSTAQTIAFAGTTANPVRVICANDAAEPPTSAATSATVTTTGASSISITGSGYIRGVSFQCATGSVVAALSVGNAANTKLTFVDCVLRNNTTAGSVVRMGFGTDGASLGSTIELINTNIGVSAANHGLAVRIGLIAWRGGALIGSAVTSLISYGSLGRGGEFVCDGVDLSGMASTATLASFSTGIGIFRARNCKLPSGWTGSPVSGDLPMGCRAELWNCDSGDTNYRIWIVTPAGSVRESTAIYVDGWAGSDTAHSYAFASNSSANESVNQLAGPEFFADNSTTGSSVTASVEIVTDGVTLTDAECWLEVMYMGTSGVPLGTWISDQRATPLTTAATQTSSSQGWTTTGLTSPVKQKLSVTFTPQEAGYVIGRVVLAKASTTVYVDPQLTLT